MKNSFNDSKTGCGTQFEAIVNRLILPANQKGPAKINLAEDFGI